MKTTSILPLLTTLALATAARGAVAFTVTDDQPGDGGSVSTTRGTVAAGDTVGFPTFTYRIENLDFTSEGGTANETVEYTISWTSSGTSMGALAVNGTGRIGVLGGQDAQIDFGNNEEAVLTLGLTANTTFDTSNITLGFTRLRFGGSNDGDNGDITLADNTVINTVGSNANYTFAPSVSLNYEATADSAIISNLQAGKNIELYEVQITAIPEPSAALLGALGSLMLLRRRR